MPPAPEVGALLQRYVITAEGQRVGEAAIYEAAAGDGLVERLFVDIEDGPRTHHLALDSWVGLAGQQPTGWWSVERHDAELTVVEADLSAGSWMRRDGLAVQRQRLDPALPLALGPGQIMPLDVTLGMSLAGWWAGLQQVGDRAELKGDYFNTLTGRLEPLQIERREEQAGWVRWFAWTPAHGHQLWTDAEGRLVGVDGFGRGWQVVAEGHTLPEPPPAPLPAGLVERAFAVERPDLRLHGTLALPPAAGPAPGIVLVVGSGGVDRDGNAGGMLRSGFYRSLAHELAAAGFVVARYDKRRVGESEGPDDLDITLPALVGDTTAVGHWLGAQPEVDPGCRFALGHSEGGTVVARVAEQDPQLAGVVMLAGAASDLVTVLEEQLEPIYRAHGGTDEDIAAARAAQQVWVRLIELGRDQELELGPGGQAASTWLASHVDQGAGGVLATDDTPLLALYGAHDFQVLPIEAERLRTALADRAGVRIVEIPGVDHMFMPTGGTLGLGRYADPDRRRDPMVLAELLGWLEAQPCVRRGRAPAAPESG